MVDDIHIAILGIFDRGRNADVPVIYLKDIVAMEYIQSERTVMRMYLSIERNPVNDKIHCLRFHI